MYELHILGSDVSTRQREFDGGSVRIGRAAELEIVVQADAQVSRHHATLRFEGNVWQIHDAGSANGTYLNSAPLEASGHRALEDRDRISLGESGHTTLVFRVREGSPVNRLVIRDDSMWEEVRPEALLADTDDPVKLRSARDRLYVLYEASRAVLSRVDDLNELLDRFKLEVVSTLKVESLIVALKDPVEGKVTYDVVNRSNRVRSTEIAGSETIIADVLASGRPYQREVEDDQEVLGPSTSFIRHRVRSVICVPLTAVGETLGALYVQNPAGAEGFGRDDFDFLVAFARHVALTVREAFSRRAAEHALAEMRRENVVLKEGIDPSDPMSTLVGPSPGMEGVRSHIHAIEDLPSTVLIMGESGTGKELVAKAIHYGGSRRDRAFVSVNVAACPEGLLESELFGHERGAFTGAAARKLGRFEQADGGTLFLDEIGEIPPATQVKLLRVLQERCFERVGGTRSISVDVRFVFATNRDLEKAVREGAFREDFYYRVNVVRIWLPPLRERPEDVLPLSEQICARLKGRLGIDVQGLSRAALALLRRYDYPGNVRELENMLERAFIRLKIRGGVMIEPDDLPLDVASASAPRSPAHLPGSYEELKLIEAGMVVEALKRTQGNKRRAALELGITPQTLYNKIAEFRLNERPGPL